MEDKYLLETEKNQVQYFALLEHFYMDLDGIAYGSIG